MPEVASSVPCSHAAEPPFATPDLVVGDTSPAIGGSTYTAVMTEIGRNYRVASDGFDAVVDTVRSDQWDCQSPCEKWRARDVVAHIVEGHRGVIANVRGGESKPLGEDEDAKQAWQLASEAIAEITDDPRAMALEVDGPTGKMQAGEIIDRFVTMDLLVHTWDLARAVGADDRLDEDAVRKSYEILKPMDDMIRRPGVFGPKLDPPADSDLQTEFLYFLGRRA
jgi:uncharacterized protein (TIGR03086 family)